MNTQLFWNQQSGFNPKDYSKENLESIKYFQCQECKLIFKDPSILLSQNHEKERYTTHQNVVGDIHYENFLNKVYLPLKQYLNQQMKGLDYGCGPGPALAEMFKRDGIQCNIFDPYFFPNKDVLDTKYDFITSTEVVEHFYHPHHEFQLLFSLLKPKGILAIMTGFAPQELHLFQSWWYHRDPTHVVFYHPHTLKYIAQIYGKELILIPENNVAIFLNEF